MKKGGGIRRPRFRDITLLIWTNLIIFFCWFKPPSRETGRDVTCSGKMRLPSKANRLNERDWGLKSIMDEGGRCAGGDPGAQDGRFAIEMRRPAPLPRKDQAI